MPKFLCNYRNIVIGLRFCWLFILRKQRIIMSLRLHYFDFLLSLQLILFLFLRPLSKSIVNKNIYWVFIPYWKLALPQWGIFTINYKVSTYSHSLYEEVISSVQYFVKNPTAHNWWIWILDQLTWFSGPYS